MKKIITLYLVGLFLCLSSSIKAQEFRGGEIWFERLGSTEYNFYFNIYLYSEDSINAPFLPLIYLGQVNDTAYLESQTYLGNSISLLKYQSNYHVPGTGSSFLVEVNNPFTVPNLVNYESNLDSFYLFKVFHITSPTTSGINSSPYFLNQQTNFSLIQGLWIHNPQAEDIEGNYLDFEFLNFEDWSNSFWEIDYEFPNAVNELSVDSISGTIKWDGILDSGFYLLGLKVTERLTPSNGYLSEIYRIMIVEITENDIISPIINLIEDYDIQVSPNPVQNILNLTIENEGKVNHNSTATFTNLLGQVIHQENIPSFDNKWEKQFDLSVYSNGIYFITIQNDSKIITKEFVVQR